MLNQLTYPLIEFEIRRRQQERLGSDFKLSDLLVRKAEAGEKFTR